MWRQRLMSPLLPSSESTQYLLQQYESIQKNCSTTLPVTTYGTTLSVASASASSSPVATGTTTGSLASSTCLGQLVEPFEDGYRSCFNISDTYNVSTGAIVAATGDALCDFHNSICLPLSCELDTLRDNPSWYVLPSYITSICKNFRFAYFILAKISQISTLPTLAMSL